MPDEDNQGIYNLLRPPVLVGFLFLAVLSGLTGWLLGGWLFDGKLIMMISTSAVFTVSGPYFSWFVLSSIIDASADGLRRRRIVDEIPGRLEGVEQRLNSLELLVRHVPDAIKHRDEELEQNRTLLEDVLTLDEAIESCLPKIEAALESGEKLADIAENLPIDPLDWEYDTDFRRPGRLTKSARLRMALPERMVSKYLKVNK